MNRVLMDDIELVERPMADDGYWFAVGVSLRRDYRLSPKLLREMSISELGEYVEAQKEYAKRDILREIYGDVHDRLVKISWLGDAMEMRIAISELCAEMMNGEGSGE